MSTLRHFYYYYAPATNALSPAPSLQIWGTPVTIRGFTITIRGV